MNTDTLSITPDDVTKLRSMLTEMTHRMERIHMEREAKNEIAGSIAELFGLKKRHINKLATAMYKQNFGEIQEEYDAITLLHEAIAGGSE